jgi:hypothetical protein
VPSHGEVDTNGIALANAKFLEYVGNPACLTEELSIGHNDTLTGLIGFVDDCRLGGNVSINVKRSFVLGAYFVWVLERPTVKAVVGGIDSTLGEPGNVTIFEGTGANSLKLTVPIEGFFCGLG